MNDNTPSPQRPSRAVFARLDRFVARTFRSRGFYLKAAIQAMLPTLEENYWTQQATAYEESIIDREFCTIMNHALHPDGPDTGTT